MELEARVNSLQERLEEITHYVLDDKGFKNHPENGSAEIHPQTTSSLPNCYRDKSYQSDILFQVATLCFVFVVALLMRFMAETQFVSISVSIAIGLLYSCSLLGWSMIPSNRHSTTAETIGGCGLIVFGLIIFEAYSHFHAISLIFSFGLYSAGIAFSAVVRQCYKRSSLSLIGTIGYPLVFAFQTPTYFSYPLFSTLLLISVGTANFGNSQLKSISKPVLAIMGWVGLFCWHRDLNAHYYLSQIQYTGSAAFILITILLSLFMLIPILSSAWKQHRLNLFEKISPVFILTFAYYFIKSEFYRQNLPPLGLEFSALSIGLSIVVLGIRPFSNRQRVPSGFYPLLAGGCALIFYTTFYFFPTASIRLPVWSICTLSLFTLAATCQRIALRSISYMIQVAIFAAYLISYVFSPSSPSIHTWHIPLALGIVSLIHYQVSHWTDTPPQRSSNSFFYKIESCRILVLLCAVVSMYFFGKTLLSQFVEYHPLALCLGSIWLTLLCGIVIFHGIQKNNREQIGLGSLLYLIAAGKIFLYDMVNGVGTYLTISLLAYGTMVGMTSYGLRKTGRGFS